MDSLIWLVVGLWQARMQKAAGCWGSCVAHFAAFMLPCAAQAAGS